MSIIMSFLLGVIIGMVVVTGLSKTSHEAKDEIIKSKEMQIRALRIYREKVEGMR